MKRDKHADGHRDSMKESAKGRFFENHACEQLNNMKDFDTMLSLNKEVGWNTELKALLSYKVQNVIITQAEETQISATTTVEKEDQKTKVSSENRL